MSDQQAPPEPLLSHEELKAIIEATASARILDRFGKLMLPGCEVVVSNELHPAYTILDMRPNLQAAKGTWTVILGTQINVTCMQGRVHSRMILVNTPDYGEQPNPGTSPGDPATSDTPAAPPSSIVLTDMDKTARETLSEATAEKPGPKLVPPPTNPADDLRIPSDDDKETVF